MLKRFGGARCFGLEDDFSAFSFYMIRYKEVHIFRKGTSENWFIGSSHLEALLLVLSGDLDRDLRLDTFCS